MSIYLLVQLSEMRKGIVNPSCTGNIDAFIGVPV